MSQPSGAPQNQVNHIFQSAVLALKQLVEVRYPGLWGLPPSEACPVDYQVLQDSPEEAVLLRLHRLALLTRLGVFKECLEGWR